MFALLTLSCSASWCFEVVLFAIPEKSRGQTWIQPESLRVVLDLAVFDSFLRAHVVDVDQPVWKMKKNMKKGKEKSFHEKTFLEKTFLK